MIFIFLTEKRGGRIAPCAGVEDETDSCDAE